MVQFVGAVTQNIPMMIVLEYHAKVSMSITPFLTLSLSINRDTRLEARINNIIISISSLSLEKDNCTDLIVFVSLQIVT